MSVAENLLRTLLRLNMESDCFMITQDEEKLEEMRELAERVQIGEATEEDFWDRAQNLDLFDPRARVPKVEADPR